MANEAYQTAEITLEDGTELTLKPLPIKFLRKFMKAWNEGLNPPKVEKKNEDTGEVELEDVVLGDDDIMDIYTTVNGIALSRALSNKVDLVDQYGNAKEFTQMSEKYRDYLEENVNVPNTEKVLQVCGGINLDDPKLLEAAMRQMEDGS